MRFYQENMGIKRAQFHIQPLRNEMSCCVMIRGHNGALSPLFWRFQFIEEVVKLIRGSSFKVQPWHEGNASLLYLIGRIDDHDRLGCLVHASVADEGSVIAVENIHSSL